jgi:DNA ligase-1
MLLSDLVAFSSEVRGTRSRLRKRASLAEALQAMGPDEIPIGVAYLSGELPQGRLGLGYATVYGTEEKGVSIPELTLSDVDAAFGRLQATSGPGSRQVRHDLLAGLLKRATADEQLFLRRLLLRELRQGALEAVMADAIASVSSAGEDDVRRALMLSGSLADVALAALTHGPEALAQFRLTLHRPVRPMLAGTAEDVEAALGRHSPVSLEVKFDGARVQLHKDGGNVAVYTRNLRDVTDHLPEVAESSSAIAADTAILDGEVIALGPEGIPRPFQVTMSRFGRKLDVAEMRESVPLSVFYFDCLHADGEDLIDLPAAKRWERLSLIVPQTHLAPRVVTDDLGLAEHFFRETLESGHEGVMVKALDAPYAAGRRGAAWLKVKPAHTLDLVVLAAEWGSGRRQGLLSNLHLGARDANTGEFVTLGKTFKGLTDVMLAWQTERFLELETRRDGHIVHVRPEQVVEIAFDGIQASSRYPGGMALRFARVKGYREDKTADEADTIETVRAIFERRAP